LINQDYGSANFARFEGIMTDTDSGVPTFGPPGGSAPVPPPDPAPMTPSYPPAPPSASAYGMTSYPSPGSPTRSLTGLAIATQVMLAVQLVATIALLFPVLHQRDLIDQLKSDRLSVSLGEATRADDRVAAVSAIVLVLYLATGIVWIIWFHRARKNVQAWAPNLQRRGPGWAIGGWVCPIVNFWFPYQMTKDILDGTQGRREDNRPTRPLLVAWWLGYVAVFVVALVQRRAAGGDTLDDITFYSNTTMALIVARLIAGVLAILVVRQLTTAQEARRAQPA
jgi:hypothetical protein